MTFWVAWALAAGLACTAPDGSAHLSAPLRLWGGGDRVGNALWIEWTGWHACDTLEERRG